MSWQIGKLEYFADLPGPRQIAGKVFAVFRRGGRSAYRVKPTSAFDKRNFAQVIGKWTTKFNTTLLGKET